MTDTAPLCSPLVDLLVVLDDLRDGLLPVLREGTDSRGRHLLPPVEHPAAHPGPREAGELGVTGDEGVGAGAEGEVGLLLGEAQGRLELSGRVSLEEMLRRRQGLDVFLHPRDRGFAWSCRAVSALTDWSGLLLVQRHIQVLKVLLRLQLGVGIHLHLELPLRTGHLLHLLQVGADVGARLG